MKFMNTLKVCRLSDKARLPTRGSELAAGLDIYSAESKTIPANSQILIKTDLQIELPAGCYGRLASRSDLASRHQIYVCAGNR